MTCELKEKPDCRTCGVCCISVADADIWAEITFEDAKRLGSAWCKRNVLGNDELNLLCCAFSGRPSYYGGIRTRWRKVRGGPLKGIEICACVALKGDPLRKVRCDVYEKRPTVCRKALQPGEKQCLQARRLFRTAVENAKR